MSSLSMDNHRAEKCGGYFGVKKGIKWIDT
jgi:hypothetical protein